MRARVDGPLRSLLQRRAPLRLGIALATALFAAPLLAPGAEAARHARPRAEASQPRKPAAHAPAAQAKAAREARPAARPARQAARAAPARVVPAASPARAAPTRGTPAARPVRAAPVDTGQRVTAALGQASRATGLDPVLLVALAWQESRFDPRARNRRSSARGLMQFTDATWLEVVRDFGPRHGLAPTAAQLQTNWQTGTIGTRNWRQMQQVLALRDNPRYAAVLAAERINRAREALQASLGRRPTAEDLYLVHLLGTAGAQRFLAGLARTPDAPAKDFVSNEALTLNREVFAAREDGRPLSLAEVHRWIGRSIAGQREMHGAMLTVLGAPAVVEVADAR
ncbi:transglycosylase SLT domain-containing protein [Paracraurococcus lichenis]|uniref:Transglycosylase SLT domain-containing protein n=1 Tax=Paracraurococcus lichenis TaxID=3064888 RepID=A0ABT9E2A8_9PROT|nr:transglycosylase SLT domain-containing protein [Paracraurococcus sp. LOR1-02]MDO9710281.1 transglycosylase SLT domain-containing protein [Paracraurococcus sp. LOR1-02]